MKKGHKQCKDCLAYYDVHHTCDGLMKALVQAHKKNEKHNRCGHLIHASEGTYCANPKPCKWHTPQSEESRQVGIQDNTLSSNGTWEERFEKEFKCKCFKCMENKNEFCTTFEYMKSYIKNLLSSERTSMIGQVEKMKEREIIALDASKLVPDRHYHKGKIHLADDVINYLKNK